MEKYEFKQRLATALYGRVDLCRHRQTGQLVAVKTMELSYAQQNRTKESGVAVQEDAFAELRVNAELKMLGGHDNVLPMVDCFIENGSIVLVMAFAGNGEFLSVLNTKLPYLTPDEITNYFRQILLGVNFLHANGIAHRDLSLENVLVSDDGALQVCDFGLASFEADAESSGAGKLQYMAPEVNACNGELYDTQAADLWSLGVMLFAMVAGRYPYAEPTRRDPEFRFLEDYGARVVLESLDVNTGGSKSAIVGVLEQLLAVNPSERTPVSTLLKQSPFADSFVSKLGSKMSSRVKGFVPLIAPTH